ncbi:MAG: hypothetical protein DVB31_14915 [Verrucomicrobia bacterium]|nr:MAG: hypothetical protein DVB31_14915 [Verrucomicrobiota bacterium]
MQRGSQQGLPAPVQRIVASLLCALVLLCGTLAAGEAIHRWLHGHDADGGTHDADVACALCLFAHAHCQHAPADPPTAQRPSGLVLGLCPVAITLLAAGSVADLRTRGPPRPRG